LASVWILNFHDVVTRLCAYPHENGKGEVLEIRCDVCDGGPPILHDHRVDTVMTIGPCREVDLYIS